MEISIEETTGILRYGGGEMISAEMPDNIAIYGLYQESPNK